ncbi:MAG: hypothetical protein EZS28_020221 [Streblomastix strix]|uniref:Uncharacterized protein n=1 Tax=Streblomastix strix TaxID=222440 RepID=A0A5J4VNV1_9EUKA|nr:MAG: hypothetical protein EZS28_020221 [Streblomastix strix]
MAGEHTLKLILNIDGVFHLLWGLVIAIAVGSYFLGFKLYEKTLQYFKIAKVIEVISSSVFLLWEIIFQILVLINFRYYYRFTNAVGALAVISIAFGTLFTTYGAISGKKTFLVAQVVTDVSVAVLFIVMIASFVSGYSTTFERIAQIIQFTAIFLAAGLGSFMSFEVFQRLGNEEGMRKFSNTAPPNKLFSGDSSLI